MAHAEHVTGRRAAAARRPQAGLAPRELAYGGLFGAAALTLPMLFHVLHLGSVFMPMYLPLVTLAFFASPRVAGATACVVPLLSGMLTGMPPFYPPVAVAMAVELAIMASVASAASRRWPRRVLPVLVAVLLVGRLLQAGAGFLVGLLVDLPPSFLSVWSVVSGWPGLVLMVVVVPPLVRALRRQRLREVAP